MVELISPPDPHSLIPPLLACLPTSFASPRPPPALLPLLSPILRQRLHIHTSGASTNNWSPLLTWDAAKGESLKDTIENATFEPHPASGEIEVGDTEPITYKRFDHETLKAQISLQEWPFTIIYLWCTGSDEGNAWKVAEVLPLDPDLRQDSTWSSSISHANESANERLVTEALQDADRAALPPQRNLSVPPADEDDYWAMYDKTPGRTPARIASVEPKLAGTSEDDYYARYGSVQPAMDSHDPDEMIEDAGQSTLQGHVLENYLSRDSEVQRERSPPPYHGILGLGLNAGGGDGDEKGLEVTQPVPSSPSTKSSEAVARLEEHAERYGLSDIGIRQHIGSSLKSMYRLAKSAGMDREEFESIVQRELETLSIYDHA
ncbi:uncharacterized protein A1O9_12151 [Exophiala aquamarina CBS 119918]|uniref:Uncharacterized protein n=1 Tax=Exophiala aquamarina CBS 119918 TaxID=1182545 RepID=A0A072NVD3_9EURO|nr:uncharacterized protein A1O9_12151 [Exophiala aquamarina CBS 119918]KEF51814.1 hypothetical protein A1O9_12151 [Exophiala aquamarina CBS 119918]